MTKCGIARVDDLIANSPGAQAITDDSDPDAVSVLRDLLICSGVRFKRVRPGSTADVRPDDSGTCPISKKELLPFDKQHPAVGALTFQRLIVPRPFAERVMGWACVTLLLDFRFTTQLKILALTRAWETDGSFSMLNLNTDGAGLSFGIIQRAQSRRRLWRPLDALKTRNQEARTIWR